MRYALTDDEWTAIKPMLPNKPRGVLRVSDQLVPNGIFRVLRSGAPCTVARFAGELRSVQCAQIPFLRTPTEALP